MYVFKYAKVDCEQKLQNNWEETEFYYWHKVCKKTKLLSGYFMKEANPCKGLQD